MESGGAVASIMDELERADEMAVLTSATPTLFFLTEAAIRFVCTFSVAVVNDRLSKRSAIRALTTLSINEAHVSDSMDCINTHTEALRSFS